MKRKWLRGASRIVWVGLKDPVRRRRWRLLVRLGCWMALASLLLLACVGCLLLGILVGRAGAAGPEAGLDVPLAVDSANSTFDEGDGSSADLELAGPARVSELYVRRAPVPDGVAAGCEGLWQGVSSWRGR
jgi:hypothetical protein